MATAALVVLGVFLTVLGIWQTVFNHAEWYGVAFVGLGIVGLIAAGVFQMLSSRRA